MPRAPLAPARPLRPRLLRGAATALALAALAAAGGGAPLRAGPTGGQVTAGEAVIATRGNVTTIRQGGQRVVIDWTSFDIDAEDVVRFLQPGRDAVALNRIVNGLPTHIRGSLLANGNVWLVNPAGVMFHAGAVVDVGGLIATTADIDDGDFMAGRDDFDTPGEPGAKVINEGTITFKEAGLAGLVAPHVENRGVIAGELGRIVVAGQESFSVDVSGDGLFEIDLRDADPSAHARAVNSGRLSAEGGLVIISAAAARDAVEAAISVGGVVEARSARVEGGAIVLDGGEGRVEVSGRLDASGARGGRIDAAGGEVHLGETARLDASGAQGAGGRIRVGGGRKGAGPEAGGLRAARAVSVERGAELSADAGAQGAGGEITLWSSEATVMFGALSARGGAARGAGGFVEVSSAGNLAFDGTVDLAAPEGRDGLLLLDPQNVFIVDAHPSPEPVSADILATEGGAADYYVTAGSLALVGGDLLIQAVDDITLEAGARVENADPDASLTLQAGRDIILRDDLLFAGGLTLSADSAAIAGGRDGTGALKLEAGLSLGASAGTLSIDSPQGIDGAAMPDGAEARFLSAAGLALPDAALHGRLAVETGGILSLQDTQAAGLSVAAADGILGAGALDIGGPVFLDTEGGEISLTDPDNRFAAPVFADTLNGGLGPADISIRARGDLAMGDVAAQALNLWAEARLVVASEISAGGPTWLDAGTEISATNTLNSFSGSLRLTGGAATVMAASGLSLAQIDLDGLTLVSDGAIVQLPDQDFDVAGAARLEAGGDLRIAAGGARFGGPLTALAGGAAELRADGPVTFAEVKAASLDLETTGPVGQSGAIETTGDARIAVSGAAVTLEAANKIGGVFTVDTRLGGAEAAAVSLAAAGDLTLGEVSAEALTLTAGGALDQAAGTRLQAGGAASVTAGGPLTLDAAGNVFGAAVSLTAEAGGTPQAARLTASGALELGAVSVGALDVSAGGAVTQSAGTAVHAAGMSSLSAPGSDITLTAAGNRFDAALTLEGAEVSLVSAAGLALRGDVSGGLTLLAADLDAAGPLSVAGRLDAAALAGADMTLGAEAAGFALSQADLDAISAGSARFAAGSGARVRAPSGADFAGQGDVTLVGPAGVALDGTVSAPGALELISAAGGVSAAGPVDVAGDFTLRAAGESTLADPGNRFARLIALDAPGRKVTLADSGAVTLAASTLGALDLRAGGDIETAGALSVTGDARLAAWDALGDGDPATLALHDIEIASPGSAVGGTLSLTGAAIALSLDGTARLADVWARDSLALSASGAARLDRVAVGDGPVTGGARRIAAGGALSVAAGGDIALADIQAGDATLGGAGTGPGGAAPAPGDVSLTRALVDGLAVGATGGTLSLTETAARGPTALGAAGGVDIRRSRFDQGLSVTATRPAGVRLDGVQAPQLAAQGPRIRLGFLRTQSLALTASGGSGAISTLSAAEVSDPGAGPVALSAAAPNPPAEADGVAEVIAEGTAALDPFAHMIEVTGETTVSADGDVALLPTARGVELDALSGDVEGELRVSDRSGLSLGALEAGALDLTADDDLTGGDGLIVQTGAARVAGAASIATSGEARLDAANDFEGAVSLRAARAALRDIDDLHLSGGHVTGDLEVEAGPGARFVMLDGLGLTAALVMDRFRVDGRLTVAAQGAMALSDLRAGVATLGGAGTRPGAPAAAPGDVLLHRAHVDTLHVAARGGGPADGVRLSDTVISAGATVSDAPDVSLHGVSFAAGAGFDPGATPGVLTLERVDFADALALDVAGDIRLGLLRTGAGRDLSLTAGGGVLKLRDAEIGFAGGTGELTLDLGPGGSARVAAPALGRFDALLRAGGDLALSAGDDVLLPSGDPAGDPRRIALGGALDLSAGGDAALSIAGDLHLAGAQAANLTLETVAAGGQDGGIAQDGAVDVAGTLSLLAAGEARLDAADNALAEVRALTGGELTLRDADGFALTQARAAAIDAAAGAGALEVSDAAAAGDLTLEADALNLARVSAEGAATLTARAGALAAEDLRVAGPARLEAADRIEAQRFALGEVSALAGGALRLTDGAAGDTLPEGLSAGAEAELTGLRLGATTLAATGEATLLGVAAEALDLTSETNVSLGGVEVAGPLDIRAAGDISAAPDSPARRDAVQVAGAQAGEVGLRVSDRIGDPSDARLTAAAEAAPGAELAAEAAAAQLSALGPARLEAGGEIALMQEPDAAGGLRNRFAAPLTLLSGGDAALEVAELVALAESRVGGDLLLRAETVVSRAEIAQLGPLSVTGAARFEADLGDVTLDHAGNAFGEVSAAARDLTLRDADGFVLRNTALSRDLSIGAGTPQAGDVTLRDVRAGGGMAVTVAGDLVAERARAAGAVFATSGAAELRESDFDALDLDAEGAAALTDLRAGRLSLATRAGAELRRVTSQEAGLSVEEDLAVADSTLRRLEASVGGDADLEDLTGDRARLAAAGALRGAGLEIGDAGFEIEGPAALGSSAFDVLALTSGGPATLTDTTAERLDLATEADAALLRVTGGQAEIRAETDLVVTDSEIARLDAEAGRDARLTNLTGARADLRAAGAVEGQALDIEAADLVSGGAATLADSRFGELGLEAGGPAALTDLEAGELTLAAAMTADLLRVSAERARIEAVGALSITDSAIADLDAATEASAALARLTSTAARVEAAGALDGEGLEIAQAELIAGAAADLRDSAFGTLDIASGGPARLTDAQADALVLRGEADAALLRVEAETATLETTADLDVEASEFGRLDATVGGDAALREVAADIARLDVAGLLDAAGLTVRDAGISSRDDVVLEGSDFAALSVESEGAVVIRDVEAEALDLSAAGDAALSEVSGAQARIEAGGDARLTDIAYDDLAVAAAEALRAVRIAAGDASLTAGSSLVLREADIARLEAAAGGDLEAEDLEIAERAALSADGAMTLARIAGGDLTAESEEALEAEDISGGEASLRTGASLDLRTARTAALSLEAEGDARAEALAVEGPLSVTAGGAAEIADADFDAGTLSAGSALTLRGARGRSLAALAGGDLTLRDVTLSAPAARRAARRAVAEAPAPGAARLEAGGEVRLIDIEMAALTLEASENLRAEDVSVDRLRLDVGGDAALRRVAARDAALAAGGDAALVDSSGEVWAASAEGRLQADETRVSRLDLSAGGDLLADALTAERAELRAGGDAALREAAVGTLALTAGGAASVAMLEAGDLALSSGGDADLRDAQVGAAELEAGGALAVEDAAGGDWTGSSGGDLDARGLDVAALRLESEGDLTLAEARFAEAALTSARAMTLDALEGGPLEAAAGEALSLRDAAISGPADLASGAAMTLERLAAGPLNAEAGGALSLADGQVEGDADLAAGGELAAARLRVAGAARIAGQGTTLSDLSVRDAASVQAGRGLSLTRADLGAAAALTSGGDMTLTDLSVAEALTLRAGLDGEGAGLAPAALRILGLRAASLDADIADALDLNAAALAGDATLRARRGDLRLGAVEIGGALRALADAGAILTRPGADAPAFTPAAPTPPGGEGPAAPGAEIAAVAFERLLHVAGPAWFDAGGDVRLAHDDISETPRLNAFDGPVSVSRAADVAIAAAGDLRLGAGATELPGGVILSGPGGIHHREGDARPGSVHLVAGGDVTEAEGARIEIAGDLLVEAGGDVRLTSGLHDFGGAFAGSGEAMEIATRGDLRLGPIAARGDFAALAGAKDAAEPASLRQTGRVEVPELAMGPEGAVDAALTREGGITVDGAADFATGADLSRDLRDAGADLILDRGDNRFGGPLSLRRIFGEVVVVEESAPGALAQDEVDGGVLRLAGLEAAGDVTLVTSDDIVLLGVLTDLGDDETPAARPEIPQAGDPAAWRAQGAADIAREDLHLYIADGSVLTLDATAGGLDAAGGGIRFDRPVDGANRVRVARDVESVAARDGLGALTLIAGEGHIRFRHYVGTGAPLGRFNILSAGDVSLGHTYAHRDPGPDAPETRFLLGRGEGEVDLLVTSHQRIDATGRVEIFTPAGLTGLYETQDDYFGLNAPSLTFGQTRAPAGLRLFGFIGDSGRRAAGLFPVGPRDSEYRLNGCVIGDVQDCTGVTAPRVLEIVRLEEPQILNVEEEDLLQLFVSYGNEELWGVPPGYFLDVALTDDDEDEEEDEDDGDDGDENDGAEADDQAAAGAGAR